MFVRAVYPGTFDPIHNGHIDIVQRAARIFDEVHVAVYEHVSTNMVKKRVLFDIDERVRLAQEALTHIENVKVALFSGFAVDYAKQVDAVVLVRGLRVFSDFEFEFRMGLANKRLAPQIETISIMTDEKHIAISSSTIREIAELGGDVTSMVPPFIAEALAKRYARN